MEYKNVNLNKIYEPNTQQKHSFEFQNSNVSNPFAVGEGKLSVFFIQYSREKRITHIATTQAMKKLFIL